VNSVNGESLYHPLGTAPAKYRHRELTLLATLSILTNLERAYQRTDILPRLNSWHYSEFRMNAGPGRNSSTPWVGWSRTYSSPDPQP
jgi:hypothetical protein